jgi:hypothetical protein
MGLDVVGDFLVVPFADGADFVGAVRFVGMIPIFLEAI